MNKIESKVIEKYKKHIRKIVRDKYKKLSLKEAQDKKIYLKKSQDIAKEKLKIQNEIFLSYYAVIEEEIRYKVDNFINSEAYKIALEAEKTIDKRKLSYKNLKKYQEFKINIDKTFLEKLYLEVNNDNEPEIKIEELKYILLSIFYKMIDFLLMGYKIKVGTLFNIWVDKRDIRINLPNIKENLASDRLIPKLKLCKSFDHKLFLAINKDNQAIINYYKAKAQRYLGIFKNK